MDHHFISSLRINNVRQLHDLEIPIADENGSLRHLIITGSNGSGKTILLGAIADKLKYSNLPDIEIKPDINAEKLITAYYKEDRKFIADVSPLIEKVELKDSYSIEEEPGRLFLKYLASMKATEAFARNSGNDKKADSIRNWFDKLTELLMDIFEDNSLQLVFDEDKFTFKIIEKGKEPFDFNTLASGYSAALAIIIDLIMRMEKKSNHDFIFSLPGIVLIDEIEAHMHHMLKGRIMKILTSLFPAIQFIVTTHSSLIIHSLQNAVIYDLGKKPASTF